MTFEIQVAAEKAPAFRNCDVCEKPVMQAKALSCKHYFCKSCVQVANSCANLDLEATSELNFPCPLCALTKEPNNAKDNNVVAPPPPTDDKPTEVALVKQDKCTFCKEGNMAISRCKECAVNLCQGCDNAHSTMKCFEGHQISKLNEVDDESRVGPYAIMCLSHNGNELKEKFCNVCETLVCTVCHTLDKETSKHELLEPLEAFTRISNRVKNATLAADIEIKQLQKRQKLELQKEELEQQVAAAKEYIEKAHSVILERVESHREAALKEYIEDTNEIKQQVEEIQKALAQLEEIMQFAIKLKQHGTPMQYLPMQRLVEAQFQRLLYGDNYENVERRLAVPFVPENLEVIRSMLEKAYGECQITVNKVPMQLLASPEPAKNWRALSANSSADSGLPTSSPNSSKTSTESHTKYDVDYLIQMGKLHALQVGLPEKPTSILKEIESNPNPPPKPNATAPPQNNKYITWRSNIVSGTEAKRIADSGVVALPNSVNTPMLQRGTALRATAVPFEPKSPEIITATTAMPPAVPSAVPPTAPPAIPAAVATAFALPSAVALPMMRATPKCPNYKPLKLERIIGRDVNELNKLCAPHGFCVTKQGQYIVADTKNHRIKKFDRFGNLMLSFGQQGKGDGQLWHPRKVGVLPNGMYVVCDLGRERSRMQIFAKNGRFVRHIPLSFVDIVAGLTVTDSGEIVIVDSVSPAIFTISPVGELLAYYDISDSIHEPSDIKVHDGKFYICDFKGHCILVCKCNGEFLCRVGTVGVTCFPNGVEVLPDETVLVIDAHGNKVHIVRYADGYLVDEYECADQTVSRVCGLQMTPDGKVATLAKLNDSVYVFDVQDLNSTF